MRPEKKLMVSEIKDRIKKSNSMIFTRYSGLGAHSMDELRGLTKQANSKYMVVKNTLFRIAAKEAKVEDYGVELGGNTGVLFIEDDPVTAAKLLVKFAKSNAALQIDGGVLDHTTLSKDEINRLASLPTREELIAKLVGQIKAPISGFVGYLGGFLRNLVGVIAQIKEQKEKASS